MSEALFKCLTSAVLTRRFERSTVYCHAHLFSAEVQLRITVSRRARRLLDDGVDVEPLAVGCDSIVSWVWCPAVDK
jgi:hypothetical protein